MTSYSIDTLRHSSAHLMAQAIERLWPKAKVQFGVGPVVEHGFYYDILMGRKLTQEDLGEIEKMMKTLIKESLDVKREVMERDQARDFFQKKGQTLKVEIIDSFSDDEEISCYRQGEFIDLCRGPHVANTRDLPTAFKILQVTGAYWRGDENRQMLQRVSAVSFKDKKVLKQHLHFLEEARKRDHRKLGKELNLFHFNPLAPASPFFMPKGAFIYNKLIDFIRKLYEDFGYSEVITPQILDSDLWRTSGHYEHYKENMYFSRIDEREYAMKPMNCPCHMLMFKHYKYSYRDLPLRYADFGRLHRYEKHGAVGGLTRVRTFCQDDAHIFLQMENIQEEIKSLMEMFLLCYNHFGFKNIKINLSTRPEKKVGDDATWDISENALKQALEHEGHIYCIQEGEGAFYGPKIDIEIADAIGRYFQLGTIQLDFQLPEKFDLHYTDADGKEKRPVVIHRALLGSLERFFGIYIEFTGGAFPFWLAPEQAVIIPVNNEYHLNYARVVEQKLLEKNFRIKIDNRNESLSYKIRQVQKSKIPFALVLGDKEKESQSVNIRGYGEKKTKTLTLSTLLDHFNKLANEAYAPKEKN